MLLESVGGTSFRAKHLESEILRGSLTGLCFDHGRRRFGLTCCRIPHADLVPFSSSRAYGFLIGPVISPDGKLLATATFNEKTNRSTVRIWDFEALTERRAVKLRHGVGFLAFSPDGRTLRGVGAALADDQLFFSIDIATGESTDRGHLGATNQFHVWASSCDGRSFAAAGELVRPGTWVTQQRNYLIHIFDATTEKFVRSLDDVKSMTSQIAFAPDNRRLATAGWDGAIVIWDATTGKRLRDLPGHRGSVSSLAFSPDGKRLASGSIDTTVLIWDASEPRPAGK